MTLSPVVRPPNSPHIGARRDWVLFDSLASTAGPDELVELCRPAIAASAWPDAITDI